MGRRYTVRMYRRDFTPMLASDVRVEALGYGWAAMGGPDEARLAAYGGPQAIPGVAGWLRCPVEIYDAGAERVWWGYVASVEIAGLQGGFGGVTASLDHMANRVAVVYQAVDGAAVRPANRWTAWAEDAGSAAEYGRKELRLALGSGTTAAAAEQARDAYLALARYPVAGVGDWGMRTGPKGSAPNFLSSGPHALIHCRGWWSTLGWEYYAQAAGREAAEEWTGQVDLGGGSGAQSLKIAQPVRPAEGTSAWRTETAAVRARLAGYPADRLAVQLCADAGGAPGTELAKGEVEGLAAGMGWVKTELSSSVEVGPGALVWLVLSRSSGQWDGANYYKAAVSGEMRYGRGACLGWNGSAWVALAPEVELAFVLAGSEETTAQASAIAASGQFVTGVDVDPACAGGAAARTCQYRAGSRTRAAEIIELLRLGLAAGSPADGRLLAEVGADRRVRIYPEPGPGEAWRASDGACPGRICGTHLEAIPDDGVVAGRWLELAGAEAYGDVGWIGGPSPAFVERCWIDVAAGRRTLYARRPEQPAEDLVARLKTEMA